MLDRIVNGASDIVIMQDGLILRDIFEIDTSGDNGNTSVPMWRYEHGANYNFLSPKKKENVASLYFAWGKPYTRTSEVLNERFFAKRKEEIYSRNVLLHPVLEWKGRQVHLMEAPLNDWGSYNPPALLRQVLDNELLPEMIRAAEKEAAGKDFHPKLSDRWINKVERRHEPPTTNVVESVTPEERDYISSMKWLEE